MKNDITSSGANDGEFETSTTTSAPASTSATPSPVIVFTPVFGDAATASWPCAASFATTFEPMRPVPPMTMTLAMFLCLSDGVPEAGVIRFDRNPASDVTPPSHRVPVVQLLRVHHDPHLVHASAPAHGIDHAHNAALAVDDDSGPAVDVAGLHIEAGILSQQVDDGRCDRRGSVGAGNAGNGSAAVDRQRGVATHQAGDSWGVGSLACRDERFDQATGSARPRCAQRRAGAVSSHVVDGATW
nr:hypothetical protein [uncultured Microbacterium sp.]